MKDMKWNPARVAGKNHTTVLCYFTPMSFVEVLQHRWSICLNSHTCIVLYYSYIYISFLRQPIIHPS